MSDLIKRSDAIKDLCDISNNSDMPEDWHRGMSVAISALYRVPPVPPADRPQGEWIDKGRNLWECSNCGMEIYSESEKDRNEFHKWCSRCGARMKGADDDRI